jgi:hypothetical protein
MCGFAEELEWLDTINEKELKAFSEKMICIIDAESGKSDLRFLY